MPMIVKAVSRQLINPDALTCLILLLYILSLCPGHAKAARANRGRARRDGHSAIGRDIKPGSARKSIYKT